MENLTIRINPSEDSGKMGRHNLGFKTGAHKDKKKDKKKYACRKNNRCCEY